MQAVAAAERFQNSPGEVFDEVREVQDGTSAQILLGREMLPEVKMSTEQVKYIVEEARRGGVQVRRLRFPCAYIMTALPRDAFVLFERACATLACVPMTPMTRARRRLPSVCRHCDPGGCVRVACVRLGACVNCMGPRRWWRSARPRG